MKTYVKDEVAWFFSAKTPRFELSNMAGGMPIYWPLEKRSENYWNSSEQLYQASKYTSDTICTPENAKDNVDPLVRARIRQHGSMGAKMTQKCAVKAGLVRPDWEVIKVDAMLWVLELKLYWNPTTFGSVLAGTGDLPIVERSRHDDFWGAIETDPGILIGENTLGLLLTDLRSRAQQVKAGQFSCPEGYLLP